MEPKKEELKDVIGRPELPSNGQDTKLEKPTNFERPGPDLEPAFTPQLPDNDEHQVEQELQAASREMPRPIQTNPTKSKARISIEKVLEQDLKDVYANLNTNEKQSFRKTGEETALKIEALLKETKFQINKILDLIKKWLMLIPGVNRFFLEQEAKIKTDEIMKLRDDLKKRGEI